uniref:YopJ family acetyltransferase n=1 Tax=Bartonella sp. AP58NXGY TaxID=3243498 RepID=UPI0035CFC3AD
MKPQDSQDSPPHSSQIPEGASVQMPEGASVQMPEGAGADASLESLATHLEQLNIEKINYTPFNRAELKDIIAGLEQHNADGSWIKNYYDILDLYMMPALVDQANRKYPEMN